MSTNDYFAVNDLFMQNAKTYQSQPVLAARYRPGMESGWIVHIYCVPYDIYEAIRFFDTKEEAMAYVEANEKQYMNIDGKLVECEVEYDTIKPVLHHKRKNPEIEDRVGEFFGLDEYVLESDESNDYDFFIIHDDSWIILEPDGKIRVWNKDCLRMGETFFGDPDKDSIVYEKIGENIYNKVDV